MRTRQGRLRDHAAVASIDVAGVVIGSVDGSRLEALLEDGELHVDLRSQQPAEASAWADQDAEMVLVVLAGEGTLEVGRDVHHLEPWVLARVPSGSSGSIHTASERLVYLSVRRRGRRAPS